MYLYHQVRLDGRPWETLLEQTVNNVPKCVPSSGNAWRANRRGWPASPSCVRLLPIHLEVWLLRPGSTNARFTDPARAAPCATWGEHTHVRMTRALAVITCCSREGLTSSLEGYVQRGFDCARAACVDAARNLIKSTMTCAGHGVFAPSARCRPEPTYAGNRTFDVCGP